jgi:hypothetical protein
LSGFFIEGPASVYRRRVFLFTYPVAGWRIEGRRFGGRLRTRPGPEVVE